MVLDDKEQVSIRWQFKWLWPKIYWNV